MARLLLDSNIYDKSQHDQETRDRLAEGINLGQVVIIATPVVAGELNDSPFRGFPDFFPIKIEAEAVAVLGYARLGMSRLGSGNVYKAHRGNSIQIKDAIIAESADKLADIFVSEDVRCRSRLDQISQRCRSMSYGDLQTWLLAQTR